MMLQLFLLLVASLLLSPIDGYRSHGVRLNMVSNSQDSKWFRSNEFLVHRAPNYGPASYDNHHRYNNIHHYRQKGLQQQPLPQQRPRNKTNLQKFLYGVTLPFKNGLCLKIILLEWLLFSSAPHFMNMFFSNHYLPKRKTLLLFRNNVSKMGMVTTSGITSQMMVLFLLLCFPIVAAAIVFGLVLFQQSPAVTIQKLISIITSQKILAQEVDNCILSPLLEEVEFRFLLPLLLGWLLRQYQDVFTERKSSRPTQQHSAKSNNKILTTVCSCLFALCHLQRYGGNTGAIVETLVGTFVTSQFLFAPAHERYGLWAAWGAHFSWNAIVARGVGRLDAVSLVLMLLCTLF